MKQLVLLFSALALTSHAFANNVPVSSNTGLRKCCFTYIGTYEKVGTQPPQSYTPTFVTQGSTLHSSVAMCNEFPPSPGNWVVYGISMEPEQTKGHYKYKVTCIQQKKACIYVPSGTKQLTIQTSVHVKGGASAPYVSQRTLNCAPDSSMLPDSNN